VNRIAWHVPDFIDDNPPPPSSFESLDDLRALPRVQRWLEDGFHLEVSREAGHRPALMAVRLAEFWVVGFLERDEPDLATWLDRKP
jgi:hypothetical protein